MTNPVVPIHSLMVHHQPFICHKKDSITLDPSVAEAVVNVQMQIYNAYKGVRFEVGDVAVSNIQSPPDDMPSVSRSIVDVDVRVYGTIKDIGVETQESVIRDFVARKVAGLIPKGNLVEYRISTENIT